MAGTVPYASPEQLDREQGELSPASDVFSLGVVLHEMLTGKRLFGNDNLSVTQMLVLRGEVAPPSAKFNEIPRDVDELCMLMLERDPKKRIQTAADVLATVTPILSRIEA